MAHVILRQVQWILQIGKAMKEARARQARSDVKYACSRILIHYHRMN